MFNKELYKEAISALKASESIFTSEVLKMTTQRKRKTPKALLIAAIAAILTVAFVGTAIATNFFGLRDTVIPDTDTTFTHEWPDGTVVEYQQQFISLQGFAGSPEHAALAEWQEFLNGYDLDALIAIIGNSRMEEVPWVYRINGAYSLEMAYRMNEILDKHGLVLRGEFVDTNANTPEEFMEYFQTNLAHGPLFTDDSIWFNGWVYENGTFTFDAAYSEIMISMRASRKGVFDDVFINIGNIDAFSEWSYVNRFGTQLILAQSNDHSIIMTETETFFFALNIHAGPDGAWLSQSEIPFTRSDLESFADLIDFGQIRTDLPALVRHEFPDHITAEAIALERGRVLAKRAELDAGQADDRD